MIGGIDTETAVGEERVGEGVETGGRRGAENVRRRKKGSVARRGRLQATILNTIYSKR